MLRAIDGFALLDDRRSIVSPSSNRATIHQYDDVHWNLIQHCRCRPSLANHGGYQLRNADKNNAALSIDCAELSLVSANLPIAQIRRSQHV